MARQRCEGISMAGASVDDDDDQHARGLMSVTDWTVADLGPSLCAFVYWRGKAVRVVVSDRVHADLVGTVAIHAKAHRSDTGSSPSWGETTAWCDTATCWAAQTWLPACLADLAVQATPA